MWPKADFDIARNLRRIDIFRMWQCQLLARALTDGNTHRQQADLMPAAPPYLAGQFASMGHRSKPIVQLVVAIE